MQIKITFQDWELMPKLFPYSYMMIYNQEKKKTKIIQIITMNSYKGIFQLFIYYTDNLNSMKED